MKVFRPSPSLMRWLAPGLYIKRWLLLLFVSIVMISLAVGYVLRDIYSSNVRFPPWVQTLTLQFLPRAVRASLFAAAGIAILLLCFYKLSQSLLGPFIRAGNNNDRRNLIEHLYAHRQLTKGPRVVALGGGTGLSTLLRGIKKYTGNIVAIVTVADDGGSSGRLNCDGRSALEYRCFARSARAYQRHRRGHGEQVRPVPDQADHGAVGRG